MPLLALWQSNKAAIGEFAIEQVVAVAGDGNIRDSSTCSQELRSYLAEVTSEKLAQYISQWLSSKIDKGGLALQDLINELGRRLDYKVENGLYQGTVNNIGFDGLWTAPENVSLVVEVKTTDAYRISLDTLASYRLKLNSAGKIGAHSSILLVVGRQDTGELEAQIRGSRHAWDVRVISAEALVKLVLLKEQSDEPETGSKIRSVLNPVEYTRLDGLVDVMFTAATDTEDKAIETPPVLTGAAAEADVPVAAVKSVDQGVDAHSSFEFTDAKSLHSKREEIIRAAETRFSSSLIKRTRALYWSPDHSTRLACTISKRYLRSASYSYWYAFHPQWDEFLQVTDRAHLLLGCMDLSEAFAVPHSVIKSLLPKLNVTETERGKYWHIHLGRDDDSSDMEMIVPRQSANLNISEYRIALQS